MFKFITGMIVGVILTFTLSAITDESIDDLEYDPDFDEDIYGKKLKLEFEKFIRPEVRMNGAEALKAQLEQDLLSVREILK